MSTKIICTPMASDYLQKKIAKDNAVGFRLTIKKTGCSGYAYQPSVVQQVNSHDELIVLENGVKIFIDVSWAHLLNGVNIDYVEENKTGLKQKKLIFTNPQETARCGCGESFTTDDKNEN